MTTENKLDRKGAIHELSIQFGNQQVAAENIKSIMDKLSEDYGKPEATKIKKLAVLLHKDTFDNVIREYNELEDLKEEIFK